MFAQQMKRIPAVVMFLLASSICHAGMKTEINADYDKFANFASFKTWNWHPAPPAHGYYFPENEHAALKSLIETELPKVGLARSSDSAQDLWVYYDVTKESTTKRVYVGHNMGDNNTDWADRSYAAGTIVLDFSDPKTNRTVWRGSIQGELAPELSKEKRIARVNEALVKLLKAFPRK
jgi:hypothetical protein